MPSPSVKDSIFNRRMLICILTGFSSAFSYELASEGLISTKMDLFSLKRIPCGNSNETN